MTLADKLKILIVDDEIELAEILSLMLAEHYDSEIFSNAHSALEAMQKTSYHYIITDLEMPEINGIQLLEKARAINSKSRIFITTGHDSSHPKVQAAIQAGVNGILTKPIMDIQQLIEVLKSANF
ncbi:MAG: response regulator [Proteobacteria bacterium]|nr:response regulator [Pseudomonadota bacterium]